MPTQYERYQGKLDPDRISREISSSDSVVARGVSAPYEGAPTPCVTEIFSLKTPDFKYVFTDALTGCAGLIAISGDTSPHTTDFNPASALVIHDKGGDKLESSQKLLEDFIIGQQKAGHGRLRLIWGNGVVKGNIAPEHTNDTRRMIDRLAQKYPHLDIKHLPQQMALVADKQGKPINLSQTPLSEVAKMETICTSGTNLDELVDLNFERRFLKAFTPTEKPTSNPVDQINDALFTGKFPPLWLVKDETMRSHLNIKTATIPTSGGDSGHYSELIKGVKEHPDAVVQEIGKQFRQL